MKLINKYANSRYSKMKNRYDIDTFDLALMRESQSYFDPKEVYFQEGQILTKPIVQQLLAKKMTAVELEKELELDPDYVDIGLNPANDEIINMLTGKSHLGLQKKYGDNSWEVWDIVLDIEKRYAKAMEVMFND